MGRNFKIHHISYQNGAYFEIWPWCNHFHHLRMFLSRRPPYSIYFDISGPVLGPSDFSFITRTLSPPLPPLFTPPSQKPSCIPFSYIFSLFHFLLLSCWRHFRSSILASRVISWNILIVRTGGSVIVIHGPWSKYFLLFPPALPPLTYPFSNDVFPEFLQASYFWNFSGSVGIFKVTHRAF